MSEKPKNPLKPENRDWRFDKVYKEVMDEFNSRYSELLPSEDGIIAGNSEISANEAGKSKKVDQDGNQVDK